MLIFIVMLGFVAAVSGCSNNSYPTSTTPTSTNPAPTTPPAVPTTTNSPATPSQNTVTAKITDAQYANNAYLISGDTLDAAAQSATSGFNINKVANSDGTTTITLSSSNPGYTNQSYTLQSGQKLYFIEKYLADDNGNSEGNVADDTAIVTDADGNIVQ